MKDDGDEAGGFGPLGYPELHEDPPASGKRRFPGHVVVCSRNGKKAGRAKPLYFLDCVSECDMTLLSLHSCNPEKWNA